MFLFLVTAICEFERMLEEAIVAYFKCISEHVLEGLMKAMNNLK
jgi:hypothetical protein